MKIRYNTFDYHGMLKFLFSICSQRDAGGGVVGEASKAYITYLLNISGRQKPSFLCRHCGDHRYSKKLGFSPGLLRGYYYYNETCHSERQFAPDEAYFWATHGGAELDLLLFKDGRRLGVECKRMDAPRLTRSMHIALNDLALDHLVVIYPGTRAYPLADRVTVVPLTELSQGGKAHFPTGTL